MAIATLARKPGRLSLLVFIFSALLFLIYIQFPGKPNFDEFHYIPSAKQFLGSLPNQNYEHPPLGKEMVAIGIGLWGDRPIGWRFMSAIFGALTAVGIYWLALSISADAIFALVATFFALTCNLLYVQSRIGMLDTFMMGFLIWAWVFWVRSASPEGSRKTLAGAGILFGLAIACKWFALFPFALAWALPFLFALLRTWKTEFRQPPPDISTIEPHWWQRYRARDWVIGMGILPLLAYAATFLPLFNVPGVQFGIGAWIDMQTRMYDGQLRVVSSHPYMSDWKSWFLMTRPIWYAFEREPTDGNLVRGVALIGNPIIMWGGLGALLVSLWQLIKRRSAVSTWILVLYSVCTLCWAVIPRKVAFYYYYYPAGLVLCLAMAQLTRIGDGYFRKPWVSLAAGLASLALFIYFFPILAGMRIPAENFRNWMWFNSWI